MPSPATPLVDARGIIRLVGQLTYQRGLGYSKAGAVSDIEWDRESGLLSSTVAGSGDDPYRCHIVLGHTNDGYRPITGDCSCPMQRNCKHVAATLLECNALHLRAETTAATSIQRGSDLTSKTTAPAPEPAVPDWKSAMTALTLPAPAAAGSLPRPLTSLPDTPLALQFELREQTPRTRDRWRGPTATTATEHTPGVEYRLGVRPAIRSSAGNWVRDNVTWNSLGFQSHRLALNADQQRWFSQFVALYRATTRDVYTGQDAEWIYLDDFHSGLLWQLLADAHRLGIQLVGTKKDGAVITVGRRATVSLDASIVDGDLVLSPVLLIDDELASAAHAGPIGSHGVYVTELAAPVSHRLAPAPETLTEEQRRVLGRDAVLTVPAADIPEFLGGYYPALRHAIEVMSSDGSVALPEIAPPVLVLTAEFKKKQSVQLDWGWEYRAGDTVRRLSIAGAPAVRARAKKAGPAFSESAIAEPEVRDEESENATLALVAEVVSSALLLLAQGSVTLQGLAAAEFSATSLPLLEDIEGVRVDIVGDRPDYRELTETPRLVLKTVETEQRDWFDLGVLVSIDGRSVPFGPLFKALSKGHKKLLLVDNTYLSLDQPVFWELQRLIEEASELSEWETTPRLSRYHASLWSEFEDLADETEQAVSWRTAVEGLTSIETIDAAPLPAGLSAELRPYQLDGYHRLAFLWQQGLGGVLADDMGLGKTLQTLALIAHAREAAPTASRAPFLVVAPTSVVSNWVAEAERFTPGLVVRGLTATQAKSNASIADSVRGADVVVTSYALFRLDFEAYQAEEWSGLVLDEAQFVKNAASRAHRCAVELNVPFKLAITGTPMENSLTDLWSLFAITAPGLFPSARRFNDEYVKPVGRGDHPEHAAELVARLRRRIRPLMMRRTKELVAKELPAKQEQVLQIELAPTHRTLYDTFLQRERQKLLGLLEDMDKNRFIVFRSLTLLRMLSLDASLVDEKYNDIPSSKLDALFEQLEDVVAEGHRALIFSQFTTFLQKAADRLAQRGIDFAYLDGSTRRRSEVISGFKKGTAPVFLISLKAGGFGLNLTEADYVFMLDPWWNPASENQAVDRTHRIGQTKSVNVYRMVATGTIEEKVMALKNKKAKLFDAVMDDDAVFSSALTADDIRGLLE